MEGYEREETGWFPPVALLPANTVKFFQGRTEP